MPGSAARRSVKRRSPISSSRQISSTQRSPTTSRPAAIGQYCPYVLSALAIVTSLDMSPF